MIKRGKGYGVVVAGVVVMLCLGVAYAWGVFVLPIQENMGWSRAAISLAVSILLLVFSGVMPIGGLLEKKIGAAKTVTLGGLFLGAAWIGSSFVQSSVWLYVCYGFLGGIGTGLCYIPSVSCGIQWFPHKKGLVTGLIIFGFGFGSAILSPVMTELIILWGWRDALLYGGVGLSAVIVLTAQLLRPPAQSHDRANAQTAHSGLEMNYKQAIKSKTFWLLFTTLFLSMMAGMMAIVHMAAFGVDRGLGAMQGAMILTVLAIFNGLGRVLAGYLFDRFGGKIILIALFVLISGGMFVLPGAGTLTAFCVLAAWIGLCFGGFMSVYPALTATFFGLKNFSVNYGLVFIGYGSGCFFGPFLGGYVYDVMRSYHVAFYSSGALALLGGACVLLFLPRDKEKNVDFGG